MSKLTYIIGEIGQNHNGSVELAKKLIDVASLPIIDSSFGYELCHMDAVKFTKRDLNEELSISEMNKPYEGPHSFGKTYGEHRQCLELSDEEHYELYKYAKEKGLEFVETICAKGAMSILNRFLPDRLKVASRDMTNLPLIEALAKTKIPIILSLGMSGEKELEDALKVIAKYHKDISILHCLSQYPAEYKNINLNAIEYLREKYPEYAIGYSDHSVGIVVPVAAVALGAEVIEKHITLSRSMKGSDHAGALGPDGVMRMVRDIRHVEDSLGKKEVRIHEAVSMARRKLERSIATRKNIETGYIIKESDLMLLSPGDGYKWSERNEVVGRAVVLPIAKNEIVKPEHIGEAQVVRV